MITPSPLPPDALLARYRDGGAYTDCFSTEVSQPVSLAQFVEAFYTGRVFRIERWLLRWLVSRPSTDAEARQVATGQIERFAAWDVEGRTAEQLLMCDLHGRTRSWFRVAPTPTGTRLYFGSAVVPRPSPGGEAPRLGFVFAALLGFHRLYSRVLLGEARSRLARLLALVP